MSTINNRLDNFSENSVALIGLPSDENSTFMRGPALAPGKIRELLHCGSANLFSENGINLSDSTKFKDIGDLKLDTGPSGFDQIEHHIFEILQKKLFALSLGGDHAVTFPILKAYAKKYSNIHILHFDAHPDLYDNFEDNPFSHASPFARIMENNLAQNLTQIGIRTLNDHQRAQVNRFNVNVIEMRDFDISHAKNLEFDGPIYISIDLDALDPAFAPGVSHHEPGGLTTRDIISIIQNIRSPIIGADIVEYNPNRDSFDTTGMVAVKLLKEVAAQILSTNA